MWTNLVVKKNSKTDVMWIKTTDVMWTKMIPHKIISRMAGDG